MSETSDGAALALRKGVRVYPKHPRKFLTNGPLVQGCMEAVRAIMNDQYLLLRGKPMHPSVMRNWSLAQLEASSQGALRHAVINPEWVAVQVEDPYEELPF